MEPENEKYECFFGLGKKHKIHGLDWTSIFTFTIPINQNVGIVYIYIFIDVLHGLYW